MIPYTRGGWGTVKLLFGYRGSVVYKSTAYALGSCVLSFLLSFFQWPGCSMESTKECGLNHPAVFTWYFTLATFMLTFHCNQAYNRFWEARSQLQSFSIYLTRTAISAITMTTPSRVDVQRDEKLNMIERSRRIEELGIFKAKFLHLMTLLHAVMIQYLLNEHITQDLEVLGGVTDNEIEYLSQCTDQVCVVDAWISELLNIGFFYKQTFMPLPPPAPIASRLWQDLGIALHSFNQSCKVEDTPFPFPYQQLMAIFALMNLLLVPLIVSEWSLDPTFCCVLTFIISFTYRSIYETTAVMESPFGVKSNDLPLIVIHDDFVGRIKDLVDEDSAMALGELLMISNLQVRMMTDGMTSAAPFTNKRQSTNQRRESLNKDTFEDGGSMHRDLKHTTGHFRKPCYQLWGNIPDSEWPNVYILRDKLDVGLIENEEKAKQDAVSILEHIPTRSVPKQKERMMDLGRSATRKRTIKNLDSWVYNRGDSSYRGGSSFHEN